MNQNQHQSDAVTDQIRNWYENSPTAQRAYTRLRADVDSIVAQVKPIVQELWDQIGPFIDPPPKEQNAPPRQGDPPPTPGSQNT